VNCRSPKKKQDVLGKSLGDEKRKNGKELLLYVMDNRLLLEVFKSCPWCKGFQADMEVPEIGRKRVRPRMLEDLALNLKGQTRPIQITFEVNESRRILSLQQHPHLLLIYHRPLSLALIQHCLTLRLKAMLQLSNQRRLHHIISRVKQLYIPRKPNVVHHLEHSRKRSTRLIPKDNSSVMLEVTRSDIKHQLLTKTKMNTKSPNSANERLPTWPDMVKSQVHPQLQPQQQ
jgi:hypothetical protein